MLASADNGDALFRFGRGSEVPETNKAQPKPSRARPAARKRPFIRQDGWQARDPHRRCLAAGGKRKQAPHMQVTGSPARPFAHSRIGVVSTSLSDFTIFSVEVLYLMK